MLGCAVKGETSRFLSGITGVGGGHGSWRKTRLGWEQDGQSQVALERAKAVNIRKNPLEDKRPELSGYNQGNIFYQIAHFGSYDWIFIEAVFL